MTAADLKTALQALGWSQAELARRLSVHVNAVSRWATGKLPVPGYASEYLRVQLKINEAMNR